jgi:DNA-binding HxlR family transcriptional regulator
MGGVGTNGCIFMKANGDVPLKNLPNLRAGEVEVLLEDVIGCRWTFTVLRAVAGGVRRPGALQRRIEGISPKVLNDRLRHFTRSGLFERVEYPEIPPRVEYGLTDFGRKFLRLVRQVERLQADLDALRGRGPGNVRGGRG